MFEDVGKKIKASAKSYVAGIGFLTGLIGLVGLVIVCYVFGVGFLPIGVVIWIFLIGMAIAIAEGRATLKYAFGELVDQSMEINRKMEQIARINEEIVNDTITANKKLEQMANQNTLILAELRKHPQEQ